jgi:predicted glutamine amidotransferase
MIATEKNTPSLDMLQAGERTNRDGGGVAWLGKNNLIHWRKNIDAKRIHSILKTVGRPAVIHFRIGTYGKNDKKLCHPFAIDAHATTTPKGQAEKVLFHNGHWSNFLDSYALAENTFGVPSGECSDTRFIAYLLYKFPEKTDNLLKLVNDKFVILSKDGVKVFGKGWVEVDGIQCSNAYFNSKSYPISSIGDDDYFRYHRRESYREERNSEWDTNAQEMRPVDYTKKFYSYKLNRYVWPGDKDYPTPPGQKISKKEEKTHAERTKENGHGKDCFCEKCLPFSDRAEGVQKFMIRHTEPCKDHPLDCLCWKCRIHDAICTCSRCLEEKSKASLNSTQTPKEEKKDAHEPRELELGRP